MLNTSVVLPVVPTESDKLRGMAETEVISLEESSPELQQSELQSTIKMTKDLHPESLHNVLKKATHSPHKFQCWPHQLTSRTAPHNLFLEGFRDCASEVIRFLTEEEMVEDNNPLLMGLQSHLRTVSKSICHETIMDLDRHDAETQEQTDSQCTQININNADKINTAVSSKTPCLISPILSRSANTSVCDSSVIESDISMSISLVSETNHQSHTHHDSTTSHNTSTEISVDHSDNQNLPTDDVFDSSSSCLLNQQKPNIPDNTTRPKTSTVQTLRELAIAAVSNSTLNEMRANSDNLHIQPVCSEGSFSSTTQSQNQMGTSRFLEEYPPPLDQSSPLPHTSLPSWTSMVSTPAGPGQPFDAIVRNNMDILQCFPAAGHSGILSQDSGLQTQSPLSLQQQSHLLLPSQESDLLGQNGLNTVSGPMTTECPPGLSQQLNSILELKANFLPGINTSSVASGNFADILLAVEACRFHDDPRVKALAEELIHLIHNDSMEDDDDDDDDDDLDEEYDDEEEENINNIARENGDESGIEMMDESADWGSAADMIEQ